MKPNRSQIIALLALVVILMWFWLNAVKPEDKDENSANKTSTENVIPTVVTQSISATNHSGVIKLFGRTEVSREVLLKAETAGNVVSTPISEGQFVKRGTVVCRQDINARKANLDQAKAQVRSRELDYKAAKELVERGFAAETQALGALAQLDAAKAMVKQAEIELDNVNIRVPFDGVFDRQIAELGDYLGPGQPCGSLIQLNPLTVSIDLTEAQLSQIKEGQKAQIKLTTGEQTEGIVTLIESRANPSTRTFRSEIKVENPDNILKAGITATVSLSSQEETAHLIPSHILTLDDNGTVGIKYVWDGKVTFTPIETIDETDAGIWVTGLPDRVDIIVQGQDFVAEGIDVNTKDEYAQ